MSDDFDSKLSLYLRSEKALFTLALREKARQAVYVIFALMALLATLVLCNIGLFYTLLDYISPQLCAFVLAGINILISVIMIIISAKKKTTGEVDALIEIRDFAKTEVADELQKSKKEIAEMGSSVKNVADDVNAILSGTAFGIQTLLPILQRILKSKKNE
jgi:hypothetical protein